MPLVIKGHRLLIKPDEVKQRFNEHVPESLKKTGFTIEMTQEQEQREEAASRTGTVVGVGATCWHSYDKTSPEWKPWCQVGDRVTFARYAGRVEEDPVTHEKFVVINDTDMFCVIEGEKAPWEA